jgi:hypothetical protein
LGILIKAGSRCAVAGGYALGAILMLAGSLCEAPIGDEAAGKSLKSVSKPFSSR